MSFGASVSLQLGRISRIFLGSFWPRCALICESVTESVVHSSAPCSDHAPFSVWQRLWAPSSPQLLGACSSHRCTASTIRPPGRSAITASSHPTLLQLEQSVVRCFDTRRCRVVDALTRRRSQVEQGRLQAGARIARRRHALDDPAEGPVAGHGLREDGRLLRGPRRRRRCGAGLPGLGVGCRQSSGLRVAPL